MENFPKVHILMPAYNAAQFIEPALRSALAQTYQPKIIVYNDGSVDRTKEIVLSLAAAAPNRIHLVSAENQGIAFARNRLIDISRNLNPDAAFMWLDSDDCFLDNNCVETVMGRMKEASAEICLYTFNINWDNNEEELRSNATSLFKYKADHDELLTKIENSGAQTVSLATCPDILRAMSHLWVKAYAAPLKQYWPYAAPGSFAEDTAPMALLLNVDRITALNRPIVNYRRHSTSATGHRVASQYLEDLPQQHRYFRACVDMSNPAKAAAALAFTKRKLDIAEATLINQVKANRPGFTQATIDAYKTMRSQFEPKSSSL